jgi:CheY-like chemotaxis protein
MVHDGLEAIDAALDHRPHVILLDIGLPRLDGYQVAQRLRSDDRLKDVRIIAVSGYGQDSDRDRSRAAGMDHHLTKPVDIDDLIALLARLTATGPRTPAG